MKLRPMLIDTMIFIILYIPIFVFANGMPTFDVTTVMQLKQQFQKLQEQYEVLKRQYIALTGSYGRGQIGLNEVAKAVTIVPGSWQDIVAQQAQGVFGIKQNYYEKQLKTIPSTLFQNPQAQNATTYKMSSNAVRVALAGSDVLYSQIQSHLNNLNKLSQLIDSTVNIKDAQDLQNRIAIENGFLKSTTAKLLAMNLNLQANILNQQNQATSANQQYYRWEINTK